MATNWYSEEKMFDYFKCIIQLGSEVYSATKTIKVFNELRNLWSKSPCPKQPSLIKLFELDFLNRYTSFSELQMLLNLSTVFWILLISENTFWSLKICKKSQLFTRSCNIISLYYYILRISSGTTPYFANKTYNLFRQKKEVPQI